MKIRTYLMYETTFLLGPPQYGLYLSLRPSLLFSKLHSDPPLRGSSPPPPGINDHSLTVVLLGFTDDEANGEVTSVLVLALLGH